MPKAHQNAELPDLTGEFPLHPAEYLFYLLFQATRQRELSMDRIAGKLGLGATKLRVIAVIGRIENCSMKDLALFSGVDRTTLTRSVDQLVRENLVERWSPAGDRRRVVVALSADGEHLHRQLMRGLSSRHAKLTAELGEARLRDAARLLQDVVRELMEDPLEAQKLLHYGQPNSSAREAAAATES